MSIKKTDRSFLDITRQRLSTSSRINVYNIFRITETNQYFLNYFRFFDIVKDVKDNDVYFYSHEALDSEWWDNISYKFYGTSYYWYLICNINDVINPYEELVEGQKIKVLKQRYLYEVFKNMREIAEL